MSQVVIGLDPSLTASAVCFYSPAYLIQPHVSVFKSKPAGRSMSLRIERYLELTGRIEEAIVEANADAIFIEGYSYGSLSKAHILGEFGGILRTALLGNHRVIEVAPPTLKLFAAGKGNASKLQVATGLIRRYNVEYDTDDEYDAYGLARLGACVLGWEEPQTAQQTKAVESLK